MQKPPKLLDRVRVAVRVRHYSRRTEEAYVGWIKRFILFHGKRHPSSMGADEVNGFLSALAVEGGVAAATQNQALSAILFPYRHVLDEPLPWIQDIVRARRPERLPVVVTAEEVRSVLSRVEGTAHLVALLLYGAGLRLLGCLRLRVKDVDFGRSELRVRDPKGRRDRATMCAPSMNATSPTASGKYGCRMRCAGSSRMRAGVGVAVDLPGHPPLARRRDGRGAPAPLARDSDPGRRSRRGARHGHREGRDVPHLPPLLRPRTCSSGARTSAPCRSSSATATWRRP